MARIVKLLGEVMHLRIMFRTPCIKEVERATRAIVRKYQAEQMQWIGRKLGDR